MAEPRHRSVDDLAESMAAASGPGVALRLIAPAAEIALRAEEEALSAIAETLGVPVPITPNTVTAGHAARVLWLGPREWLVVAPDGAGAGLAAALEAASDGRLITAVDVSAGRIALELSGPYAFDVLAHGCGLDLRDGAFAVSACAQTLVARIPVLLERADAQRWVLRLRPSCVPYLVAWLLDAMAEYAPLSAAAASSARG